MALNVKKCVQLNKNSGIRNLTKHKQKPKTVIVTPYEFSWPTLHEKEEACLRDKLSNTISSLSLGRLKKKNLRPEGEITDVKLKNAAKKELICDHWKKNSENRLHFMFGISEVIRGLERNDLLAVLVSNDVKPLMMIDPLLSLCRSRNIRASAIKGLGTTLQKSLNFHSCSAIAFKKSITTLERRHPIAQLYDAVESLLPTLTGPDFNTDLFKLPDKVVSEPVINLTAKPAAKKDFTHLYIRKDQLAPVKSEHDFIPIGSASTNTAKSSLHPIVKSVNPRKRYRDMKMKRINPKKAKL